MTSDPIEGLTKRADRYRSLVRDEMRHVVGDSPDGLYAWMRYHLGWEDIEGHPEHASGGKMLRPVAVLLATEACGGRAEQAVPAAAAVELVHNFSLLHDDVEDRSDFRRGRANVWTFAGVAQAINTGDGMFTLARLATYRLIEAGIPAERVVAAMRELDEACMRLVEGQYLDISFETRIDVTQDEYWQMAAGKTAAMFAAPFAMGAAIAGATPRVVEAFREFGRHIGLAFQAVDDILGIWGDSAVTGKPVGDDLLSRKMTYPVIAALDAGGDASMLLRRAYGQASKPGEDVAPLAALITETGARALTQSMAEHEEAAALGALRAGGLSPEVIAWCTEFARAAVVRVT
ncbi:MAG: polyprenyl synthetase family protein [Dehalococcoidia bacterium]|nr:MAG: polyprenyl synthetase family protein [Dehalococcoidia bacterium]